MTTITVKRLDSGYYLIRGEGPCNWSQVPHWPCAGEVIREHAFPEASEEFLRLADWFAHVVCETRAESEAPID